MNKREAAVISAFTGVLIGEFSDLHEYIEEILDRPVFTHELTSEVVTDEIKERSRAELLDISDSITRD